MRCATRFRHELHHDAPVEDVGAMLADPAFREAACAAQDAVSAEVAVEGAPHDAGMRVVVDQVQRTDDLPAVAQKLAGATTRAVQHEEWTSATTTLVIEAPGKPSTIRGTILLEPDGSGTREVVELDLAVRVPLVGGKLLADKIRAGMDAEHGVGTPWLKGDRV